MGDADGAITGQHRPSWIMGHNGSSKSKLGRRPSPQGCYGALLESATFAGWATAHKVDGALEPWRGLRLDCTRMQCADGWLGVHSPAPRKFHDQGKFHRPRRPLPLLRRHIGFLLYRVRAS